MALRGRVWYHLKAHHNEHNLSIETVSLSSNTLCKCLGWEPDPPNWEGGVELWGRAWYNVKFLSIRYNLFAGTETLSLSVDEPIAIQIVLGGTVPQFGRGVELGVGCGTP